MPIDVGNDQGRASPASLHATRHVYLRIWRLLRNPEFLTALFIALCMLGAAS